MKSERGFPSVLLQLQMLQKISISLIAHKQYKAVQEVDLPVKLLKDNKEFFLEKN